MEENVIPHIMGYASCIRKDGVSACEKETDSNAVYIHAVALVSILLVLVHGLV
jgi:hypothetical protein